MRHDVFISGFCRTSANCIYLLTDFNIALPSQDDTVRAGRRKKQSSLRILIRCLR